MGERTQVPWATDTYNEWIGCTKYAAACANCYAAELDLHRFSKTLAPGTKEKPISHWGPNAPRSICSEYTRLAPYRWNKYPKACPKCLKAYSESFGFCPNCRLGNSMLLLRRRRVFCGSLMDWADNRVSDQGRDALFEKAEACDSLVWMFLTKRGKNAEIYLARRYGANIPKHFWFGISWMDEKQDEIDAFTSIIGASVLFLSVEPLIKEVNLERYLAPSSTFEIDGEAEATCDQSLFDWVIVGGESGSKRRDCGVDAIAQVAHQCQLLEVPVFVKQDCAQKPDQQGRIPDSIWQLKQFPSAYGRTV